MKVTVYITAYNYGEFVEEAINSVLYQSFEDWELIVINDGSTDNTREVISKYENDARVKIIHQENKGLNVSNNIALRLSRGEYIMRLDADDFLHKQALELLSKYLDENLDKDLVFPNYFEVDLDSIPVKEVKIRKIDDGDLLDMPAHGACTMFRTSVLRMLGGYLEDYSCQDGYELWLRFIQNHSPGNIAESLFYYRQHPSSLSKDKEKILKTRRQIKSDFINSRKEKLPKVAGVVLASRQTLFKENDPFCILNGQHLIDYTLNSVKNARNLDNVIVSSESVEVLDYVTEHIPVIKHHRTENLSHRDVKREDILLSVRELIKQESPDVEYICVLNINSPLRTWEHIDWAINTLKVFDLDKVLSVDEELGNLYTHEKNGLESLNQQQQSLKLERDSVFQENGAITILPLENFDNGKAKLKVGHISLLPYESVRINSKYEFWLSEQILKSKGAF
tara:strand:+ start:13004 stop:14359 length:1356 start_codon:yes stop_codon:yes gene_type:complete